ncbi:MAG: hypothetical protein JOZ17_12665 [Acetobacteraceae bacterium]|nr:hypothetical protein [Acetobacteraceae bacterium]MBV8615532.1 hypothetical protein [Acetobacteraceae bacterium]
MAYAIGRYTAEERVAQWNSWRRIAVFHAAGCTGCPTGVRWVRGQGPKRRNFGGGTTQENAMNHYRNATTLSLSAGAAVV